jgi:hypothetical protein
VKLFTPPVSEAIDWFEATYELDANGMTTPRHRRIGLPGPGSDGEQDAGLMSAIDVVATTTDKCIQKAIKDAEAAKAAAADE